MRRSVLHRTVHCFTFDDIQFAFRAFPASMTNLVRAASLTNYREVAIASGLNPARMLLDAGLDPNVLQEPDLMIPVVRFGQLLQASAEASGNESFGLCMAESRRLSNLGAVGLLIRDQASLRDSLNVLMRYRLVLNSALSWELEEARELVMIRENLIAGSVHQPTRQRTELALGVMIRIIRQQLGADWKPLRVCFEHAAPQDMTVHRRMFGQRIDFGQQFNCIMCTQADLDRPNPSADPAMVRYAQKLLHSVGRSRNSSVPDNARRTILLLMPSGHCGVKQVAEHLGMISRTLQRHLADQDLTFHSIVNDIRKELVVRYVEESDRPLTEVASLLGFAAPSTFSRWYQTQFSCSAKERRAKLRSPCQPLPEGDAPT
jgi:AraC-like DNA-binding protein